LSEIYALQGSFRNSRAASVVRHVTKLPIYPALRNGFRHDELRIGLLSLWLIIFWPHYTMRYISRRLLKICKGRPKHIHVCILNFAPITKMMWN